MNVCILSLEIFVLTFLLIYDHVFRRLPNKYLTILLFVVFMRIVANEMKIDMTCLLLLILIVFMMFTIHAVGAGDAKLLIIMGLQFDRLENTFILCTSILIGIFVGLLYKWKDNKPNLTSSFFSGRTQFPFMYACYPVYLFFILER